MKELDIILTPRTRAGTSGQIILLQMGSSHCSALVCHCEVIKLTQDKIRAYVPTSVTL